MKDIKAVSIVLRSEDHAHLTARSERKGMTPSDLAREYVRTGLELADELNVEERHRVGIEALEALAAIRERLPEAGPVDAAQLIHEGREDLDHRTEL